ncbi:MAG TPA: Rieske 2Fe-2S domain-containing protein [Modicisalibacter sp.]|nr:Rieske 2Fe-2S domain-containing protein [Modicisalibacter sp.]
MSDPALAHLSQLDATGALGLTLADGRAAFVVRVHGRVFAFENRCPHQGIGLDYAPNVFLEPGGELIQCSMHGALFLPEGGECVSGPCQGQTLIPIAISVDEAGDIHLADE